MSHRPRPQLGVAAWFTGAALLSVAQLAQPQPAQPAPAQPGTPGAPPGPTATAPAAAPTAPAATTTAAPTAPPPSTVTPPPPTAVAPTEPPPPEPVAPPATVELTPLPPPEPVITDEGPEIVEEEAGESPLSFFMFVDANYAITTSHRDSVSPPHRAYEANGADGTVANGFALEWVGIDASYDGGEVGATASLRFGDAVPTYFGDRGPAGIANLTQGYLTWTPHSRVSLDLGQFGTIYGAEVGESWNNLNYTRGALYYAMQPFFHTGLKGAFAISDAFGVNAMVVNGVNSTFDEDDAPSVGLQFAITPGDVFELYLGGLQTLDDEADSSLFDTFIDLVALVHAGDFTGVINADFDISRNSVEDDAGNVSDGTFYGVSAAAGYSFTHLFGAALRYELLGDPDNLIYASQDEGTTVHTLTGTLDLKPLPDRDNLVVRWDNRYEFADDDIFNNTTNEPANGWFASVVGVVVKMDE